MKTPVNIKQVKIRNLSQFVNDSFNYEDTVYFQGRAQIVQVTGKNRQDGTQDVDYIAKADIVEVKKGKDNPVSVTDNAKIEEKSPSQAVRHLAYRISQNTGDDPEELYRKSQSEGAIDWLLSYEQSIIGYE